MAKKTTNTIQYNEPHLPQDKKHTSASNRKPERGGKGGEGGGGGEEEEEGKAIEMNKGEEVEGDPKVKRKKLKSHLRFEPPHNPTATPRLAPRYETITLDLSPRR